MSFNDRTVKLTEQAIEALKSHRARQNEERLRLGSLWEDHDLIFPNTIGKPMNADNLYHREFRPLLKKAGLSGFTFHSLRHTCATLLCSKNVNPKIVQEMMGHANISQTMDTYSHVMPGMGMLLPQRLKRHFRSLLLLPYCCQKPPGKSPGAFVFLRFAGISLARSAGLEPATF